MDANEAYRRGQIDMRRQIEKRFWKYEFHSDFLGAVKGPPGRISAVPVHIRRHCKVRDLPQQEPR